MIVDGYAVVFFKEKRREKQKKKQEKGREESLLNAKLNKYVVLEIKVRCMFRFVAFGG